MASKGEIDMCRTHVRMGAVHIARQEGIIARLAEIGADTGLAEQLLVNLEDAQRLHFVHLRRALRA